MVNWSDSQLRFFKPTDFRFPDKLEHDTVLSLDYFSQIIGTKAVVISDWRSYDEANPNSQHPLGKAVDVVFPEQTDSEYVYNEALASGLFGGVGIYVNEYGAVSFHLDVRSELATWGGVYSQVGMERAVRYTTADAVLALLPEKKTLILYLVYAGFLYILLAER
jgi:hypothetical protein